VAIYIATPLEIRLWNTPGTGIRVAVRDIRWDAVSWKEPDFDILRCPLSCIYASADSVERCSVRGVGGGCGTAAGVEVRVSVAIV
jgi:hypothetical protein